MSKAYLENFWDTEQKNVLFVLMPFHKKLDKKFKAINTIAKKVGLECAERIDRNLTSDLIPNKILYNIANSKFLLFDLSDDPKHYSCKQINGSVLYELGMARAIREESDMLIIRDKKSKSTIPFNIQQLPRHELDETLNGLERLLRDALENQQWHKGKRVRATAEKLDMYPFMLKNIINEHYRNIPEGEPDHFYHIPSTDLFTQLSINRLLDFGILRLGTGKQATELSYNWTPFGRAVLKSLNIEKKPKTQ